MPYPQKSDGYIDIDLIFKMVVGTLKRPIDDMDKLTSKQLNLLLSNHYENEKEYYTMIAHSFRAGFVSAHNGKKIELYQSDEASVDKKQVTKKIRETDIKDLKDSFNIKY